MGRGQLCSKEGGKRRVEGKERETERAGLRNLVGAEDVTWPVLMNAPVLLLYPRTHQMADFYETGTYESCKKSVQTPSARYHDTLQWTPEFPWHCVRVMYSCIIDATCYNTSRMGEPHVSRDSLQNRVILANRIEYQGREEIRVQSIIMFGGE